VRGSRRSAASGRPTRATLYILLPLHRGRDRPGLARRAPEFDDGGGHTLEGAQQTIARGPFASQEIIKELGTNGGGPLNANSAHPFENPTPLTNWAEMFAILIIPFGLTYTFGRMTGDQRQGWTIFAAMAGVLIVGAIVAMAGETGADPLFPAGVDQGLGSMEGKEVRIGAGAGGLFAAITAGTSSGAVNAMHDSFQPMAGLVPLFLMQLGEVAPGGVGAGLYGMLILGAILSVFIAGLMVGRTPEYLCKTVESFEMKMAMLVVILLGASILGFTPWPWPPPKGRQAP
jgi:K+-transporting ATPase ATPase A chain